MPKSIILTNADRVARYAAEALNKEALDAHEHKRPLHVFLSGGSTPTLLFSLLADEYAERIPWPGLHLWWGDERCVPPDDSESNYGAARDLLLARVSIPGGNTHRIVGEADPEREAERYTQELIHSLPVNQHGIPIADWVILGMGNDGHTASLFPHMLPLDKKSICLVAEHPASGQRRVSLGAGTICAAKKVSVLVTGESKANIVKEVFSRAAEAEHYPITHITRNCGHAEWIMDNAAASGVL